MPGGEQGIRDTQQGKKNDRPIGKDGEKQKYDRLQQPDDGAQKTAFYSKASRLHGYWAHIPAAVGLNDDEAHSHGKKHATENLFWQKTGPDLAQPLRVAEVEEHEQPEKDPREEKSRSDFTQREAEQCSGADESEKPEPARMITQKGPARAEGFTLAVVTGIEQSVDRVDDPSR